MNAERSERKKVEGNLAFWGIKNHRLRPFGGRAPGAPPLPGSASARLINM